MNTTNLVKSVDLKQPAYDVSRQNVWTFYFKPGVWLDRDHLLECLTCGEIVIEDVSGSIIYRGETIGYAKTDFWDETFEVIPREVENG